MKQKSIDFHSKDEFDANIRKHKASEAAADLNSGADLEIKRSRGEADDSSTDEDYQSEGESESSVGEEYDEDYESEDGEGSADEDYESENGQESADEE